jgi:hypothetical protein
MNEEVAPSFKEIGETPACTLAATLESFEDGLTDRILHSGKLG